MGTIPDQIIERVRDAHDVVELVGRSFTLKKAGSAWKACCPFHDEKTPSFTVNPRLQIFKCFGCGKAGNVFHWLMETEGLSFPEAVRRLAEERGIEVPTSGRAPDPAALDRKQRLMRALELAGRWFQHTLGSAAGEEARRYLAKRGYDAPAIERFGLGYAPPGWDGLIAMGGRRDMPPELLEEAGLAKPRERGPGHYDAYRHRVIFPIRDWQGRLVTFAGRALDPDTPAKYINGPETAVFQKSKLLYALDVARQPIQKAGFALLLEGYTDVLMCHMHGIEQAVAGMGTAFTEHQGRLLGRFTDRVVLLYDGDAAGQTAAERTIEVLLPLGFGVGVATLPVGRDVDEILIEEGRGAVDRILEAAVDWLPFRLAAERARHDDATPRGRSKIAESLVASILKVKSPIEQQQLLKVVAEEVGGDLGALGAEQVLRKQAIDALRKQARRPRRPAAAPPADPARSPGVPADPLSQQRHEHQAMVQRGYLAGALRDEALRNAVFRAVGPEEFTVPALQRLYNALFDLYERDLPCDRAQLAARFPQDPDVLAALAELPDDPALVERVEGQIAFLERRRASAERDRRVREQLAQASLGLDAAPSAQGESVSEHLRDADAEAPSHSTLRAPGPTAPANGAPNVRPAQPRSSTPKPPAPADVVHDVGLDELGAPWEPPVLDGPDPSYLPPDRSPDDGFDDSTGPPPGAREAVEGSDGGDPRLSD